MDRRKKYQAEYNKKKIHKSREEGLCVGCHKNPSANGRVRCIPCLERDREATKRYRKRHPEKRKLSSYRWQLKSQYGLSVEEYEEIRRKQNDRCAICGDKFSKLPSNQIHVDHCHDKQTVRGILCIRCNTSLGVIEKNLKLLPDMLEYLGES